jgi:hypothetical protein
VECQGVAKIYFPQNVYLLYALENFFLDLPLQSSVVSRFRFTLTMTSLTAEEFLALVWPRKLLTNETLELRLRNRNETNPQKAIKRRFASSVEEFLEKAKRYSGTFDVYFALGTRYGMTGGTKRDVYRVNSTWADLDNRKIKDCAFDPRPDVVVNSGGGVHAYWLLDSPYLIRGEGERWKPIEAVNRALAQKFDGDRNTIDISRVLRVPGTLNHKFSPPRQVKAFAL